MKIAFNNHLESLYAIDYCINRGQNIIRQTDASEEAQFFDDLYRVYLEKVTDSTRYDVAQLGDYHRKAEYALNPQNALPDLTALEAFFSEHQQLQDRIISDIQNSPEVTQLHLDGLRDFLGIDSAIDITLIPSMFINGGFGVFNGSSNIIVGVKYNSSLGRYAIAENITTEIYHELALPYVRMMLYEDGIHVPAGNPGASNGEYLVEMITRVLTIIFSSRLYGDEYVEKALAEQDKTSLAQARIFISVYLENKSRIFNLRDYIELLLQSGLIAK